MSGLLAFNPGRRLSIPIFSSEWPNWVIKKAGTSHLTTPKPPDVEGYERNYRELAARKVDVFLAVGTEQALRAALLAAEGKPIVLLAIDFDPVARG